MYFVKVFALVGFFASAALAAPNAEPNNPPKQPPPQPQPQPPQQQNVCGNNAAPYCCTAGKQGYSSCYAFQFSSQCSQTIVCCNANNSVQQCIGNAEVVNSPYPRI